MAAASENQAPNLARTNSATDPGQCWICYLDASETPGQRWVNACPCTLEAHETCLLEWITREEHEGRSRDGKLKCPQCKATITTQEPYDLVYAIRNRLHRAYSRISPGILAGTLATGSVVGSAWYGYQAFAIFAGHKQAERWVFGRSFPPSSPMVMLKLFALSHVGPGLVIARLIPRVEYLILPFSTLYAASLMHREPLQQWPPSPEWIITLLPSIHITYCNLYQKFLGPLERRINKTLRGGNLDNLDAGADGAAPAAAAAAVPEPPARGEPGFFANAVDMANAVVGLFQGNGEEGGLELEVRIDAAIADADDEEEADNDHVVVVGRDQPPEAAAVPPPPPAVPAAPAQRPAVQQEQPQNNNNNNNNRRERNNDIVWPSLTDVLNHMATSLALPTISWLMGELIRKAITGPSITSSVLRRRLYTPPPTGLLQHRWGRSLVGGCLFIVLKDALVLYAKYRGAEAKKNRRIKEVPKRTSNVSTGTGMTPPAASGGTTP